MERLKEAVATVCKALYEDEGYYIGWKANIAMAFKDEWDKKARERDFIDLGKLDIHEIANTAADNFLKLLITK